MTYSTQGAVNQSQVANNRSVGEQLPQTGETNSSSLTLLGSVTLIAGVYIVNLKRKKKW